MLHTSAYLLARLIGQLVVALPLNRVARVERDGRAFYRKRRRWYAPLLIAASACGTSPPRFMVLRADEWRAQEAALHRLLYGALVRFCPTGELELPACPGVTLAALLASARHTRGERRRALAAAIAALHSLHRLHVGGRPFSHGDATVENVTYDPATGRAHWFDFETAHDPRRPHAWRCADDLRALLFSAAAHLDATTLAETLAAHYPDGPALAELRGLASHLAHWPDPLHLAQARIGYAAHQALCAALQP